MPARARPINWDLLINPISQGLQMETQSTSKLGSLIAGAGEDIGKGFVRRRVEAESKRRFDITEARQREAQIDLKRELAVGRQADRAAILGVAGSWADDVIRQAAQTGQVDPNTMAAGQRLAPAVASVVGPSMPFGGTMSRPQNDYERNHPGQPFDPQAAQDEGYTPEGMNQKASAGMTLGAAPATAAPAVAPAASPAVVAAPQSQPLVGPDGVEIPRSSEEEAADAARYDELRKNAEAARRNYVIASSKYSLESDPGVKLKLKKLQDAETALAAAAGWYRRRAAVAGKAEADVLEQQRFMREQAAREAAARATEERHAKAKKEEGYTTATNELQQFSAAAQGDERLKDMTNDEMTLFADAIQHGMKAETAISQLLGVRNEKQQRAKDAEIKARADAAAARAQEKHEAFMASLPVREERAKAALAASDATAYEKEVVDAEQDVARIDRKLHDAQNDWPKDQAEIDRLKTALATAEASMYRLRSGRPRRGVTTQPATVDTGPSKDDIAPIGNTQDEWDQMSSEAKAIVRRTLAGKR